MLQTCFPHYLSDIEPIFNIGTNVTFNDNKKYYFVYKLYLIFNDFFEI